jgi:DNA helicase IV
MAQRLESFHDDELQLTSKALLDALNAPRSDTMRDIVATIQAEQDEVIRLPHRGVLVIEGGPGTGKTAVALHRVAYLLYAQRERLSRQGVLVVGPNPGFLRYIGEDWPELAADVHRELTGHPDVRRAVTTLWPVLTACELLADLYAGRCFALGYPELHRDDPHAWTVSDVPLLDEAAELLGSDGAAERRAADERRQAVEYAQGVLHVIDTDQVMHEDELRAVDLVDAEWLADRHTALDHRVLAERAAVDREWTYGHVVVDEAQELSEMDWRVLSRRSPNRSMTIVGDLAQRQGEAGVRDWRLALAPLARDRWEYRRLTVNYRTPAEIMAYAATTLAEVDPTAVPPTSVRHGEPPLEVTGADPESFRPTRGTFAVISPDGPLTPCAAKGF